MAEYDYDIDIDEQIGDDGGKKKPPLPGLSKEGKPALPGLETSKKKEDFPLLYKRQKTSSIPSLLSGSHPLYSEEKTALTMAKPQTEKERIESGVRTITTEATPKDDDDLTMEAVNRLSGKKATTDDPVGELVGGLKITKDELDKQTKGRQISQSEAKEFSILNKQIDLLKNRTFETGQEAESYLQKDMAGIPLSQIPIEELRAKAGNNVTKQLAVDRYDRLRKVQDAFKGGQRTFDEAALYYAAENGDETVKYLLEKAGGVGGGTEATSAVPLAVKGEKKLQFLMNRDVQEMAKTNPELRRKIGEEIYNFPNHHPEYAVRLLADAIAQRREDKNGNNSFANIVGKEYTDKIFNELVEDGTIPANYKPLYEREIRPKLGTFRSIGRGIGNAIPGINQLVNESPIATPGIGENLIEGFEGWQKGTAAAIADLAGIRDAAQSDAQQTYLALKKGYETPTLQPRGIAHNLSMHGAQMGGFVLGLAGGTAALNATNLIKSPALASAVVMATSTHADNKDRAKLLLPGDKMSQTIHTMTMDALNGVMGRFLPGQQIPRLLAGSQKPIAELLKKMVDGEITTAAAKNGILNLLSNTAKGSLRGGEFMGAIGAADDALTQILQGKGIDFSQTLEHGWESFKLGVISTVFVAGIEAKLKNNKGLREEILSMARNPEYYKELANAEAAKNPEFAKIKDDIITNIDETSKVLQTLDATKLTTKEKENYAINFLTEKIKRVKAETEVDPTAKKILQKEVKNISELQEGALKGIPEEKIKENQAIKEVKEMYDGGYLSREANQFLESKKTEDAEGKFDESKVKSFIEEVAKNPDKKYPTSIKDIADEMFPEYKKKAEEADIDAEIEKNKIPAATEAKPVVTPEGVAMSVEDKKADIEDRREDALGAAHYKNESGEKIFTKRVNGKWVDSGETEKSVNAKYDAELAELEKQSTPQVKSEGVVDKVSNVGGDVEIVGKNGNTLEQHSDRLSELDKQGNQDKIWEEVADFTGDEKNKKRLNELLKGMKPEKLNDADFEKYREITGYIDAEYWAMVNPQKHNLSELKKYQEKFGDQSLSKQESESAKPPTQPTEQQPTVSETKQESVLGSGVDLKGKPKGDAMLTEDEYVKKYFKPKSAYGKSYPEDLAKEDYKEIVKTASEKNDIVFDGKDYWWHEPQDNIWFKLDKEGNVIDDAISDSKPKGSGISQYEYEIKLGKMTAQDAKTIIESAGLTVPKDIIELVEKEPTRKAEAKQEGGEPPLPPPPKPPSSEMPDGDAMKELDKLANNVPDSGKIAEYMSKETIEKYTGETPTNDQTRGVQELQIALEHGEKIIEKAQIVFGKDYVDKTLDYIDNSTASVSNKALMYVSLENALGREKLLNPEKAADITKQQALVYEQSQKFARENSLALNYQKLRRIAKAGYDIEKVTDSFFSAEELVAKKDIKKAVESDADAIQKEAEHQETAGMTPEVEKLVQEGVEKEIAKIYDKLPKEKKSVVDKAIAALEAAQKKLRSKTYDAGLGIPVAIVDAGITTVKLALKAGVKIADAIELGIAKIKEKYGKALEKSREEELRKDLTEVFSKIKSTTDLVKDALIKKGFGRELTVKGEKKTILDWKKLAGKAGTVSKISENVADVMKDSGLSGKEVDAMKDELVKEYIDLRASVIEKAQTELARRNKENVTPEQKSAARKLAELYTYGLFESKENEFDVALNKALGASVSEQGYSEAKEIAKAMETIYTTTFKGTKLSDISGKAAIEKLEDRLRVLLFREARQQGNNNLKVATIVRNFFEVQQTMLLNNLKQTIENPLSGLQQRIIDKIGDWKGGELPKQQRKLMKDVYKDIVLKGGAGFGKVESTFVNRQHIDDFINKLSDNELYHGIMSVATGKVTLNAMDAMWKAGMTEKKFASNLIKVLTHETNKNRMSPEEAQKFVTEKLTGQTFADAQKTATEMIDKINKEAGSELIPTHKFQVDRVANDIVKASLEMGGKITSEQVTAAYNAAYRSASLNLGHTANNFLSAMLHGQSAKIEGALNQAIKNKEWNRATLLTYYSVFYRNILNPFVGGGTNWLVLKMEKTGLGLFTGLMYRAGTKTQLDMTTERGQKLMEARLYNQSRIKDNFMRGVVGGITSAVAYGSFLGLAGTDDYRRWRATNQWAARYLDVITPEAMLAHMAVENKTIPKYASQSFNRNDAFDATTKIIKSGVYFSKGESGKGWGALGEAVGGKINAPLPWRLVKDGQVIYQGVTGQDPYHGNYKASNGFMSGVLQGGVIEWLGFRPVSEDSGNRQKQQPKQPKKQVKTD